MVKINKSFYLILILLFVSCDAHYSPQTKMSGRTKTFDVKYLNTEINKINTKLLLENSLVFSEYGFVELVYDDNEPYRDIPFAGRKNYSKKYVPFSTYGKQHSRFPIDKNISKALKEGKRDIKLLNFNKNILASNPFWNEENHKICISNDSLIKLLDLKEFEDKFVFLPIVSMLSYNIKSGVGQEYSWEFEEYKFDFFLIYNKEVVFKNTVIVLYSCETKQKEFDEQIMNEIIKNVLDEVYH